MNISGYSDNLLSELDAIFNNSMFVPSTTIERADKSDKQVEYANTAESESTER